MDNYNVSCHLPTLISLPFRDILHKLVIPTPKKRDNYHRNPFTYSHKPPFQSFNIYTSDTSIHIKGTS